MLGYVGAAIIEPACIALPVTSDMVTEDGLVADHDVQRRLSETLEILVGACSRKG